MHWFYFQLHSRIYLKIVLLLLDITWYYPFDRCQKFHWRATLSTFIVSKGAQFGEKPWKEVFNSWGAKRIVFSIKSSISFWRLQYCLLLNFSWGGLVVQMGIHLGLKVQVNFLVLLIWADWFSQIILLWHQCNESSPLGF